MKKGKAMRNGKKYLEYYLKGNRFKILSKNGYGTIPSIIDYPPLPAVLACISITIELLIIMSTKLLSSEVDLDIQIEEENHDDDQTFKNMEQEIECPRCYDIMTLSSNFDRLGYSCQECDLLLVMK